uniref:Glycine N-acyltransferase-like protein n=1 Tax=Laticauda laticaudata TaxID=8630 RepID=A0A8C5WXQ4_LATLA
MLILTCSSKLQLLESVLRKGLPETLLVCGAVMHINRGNPAQHEVMVDSWPEFKAVLTRPQKEVGNYSKIGAGGEPHKKHRYLGHKIHSGGAVALFLCLVFFNISLPSWPDLTNSPIPSHGVSHVLRSELLHLGTLSPSDAPLVNDNWAFASNDRSLRYLKSLIEDFPNACLLDQKGQLIAWCLSDAIGCLTHAYTLPEYQGKGHMKTVLQALGRKLQAKDFALYGSVLPENQNSKKLLISQGFHLFTAAAIKNGHLMPFPKVCKP